MAKLLKTTSKPQECVCETCLLSCSCYFHATPSNAHLSNGAAGINRNLGFFLKLILGIKYQNFLQMKQCVPNSISGTPHLYLEVRQYLYHGNWPKKKKMTNQRLLAPPPPPQLVFKIYWHTILDVPFGPTKP